MRELLSYQVFRIVRVPFFQFFSWRRRDEKPDLSQVRRVLVVRVDQIGDVVMTGPFLRELRRNLPEAWMSLVVNPNVFELVELCPHINEVLTYDWDVRSPLCRVCRHGRVLGLAWKHLWPRHFQLAILPRWGTDFFGASFVALLSGARWRVAYSEKVTDRKAKLNMGFDCLFSYVLNENAVKHEVERNLDVLRLLGGAVREEQLELYLGEEDEAFAEETLTSHGIRDSDLLIAFSPGAGIEKRRWPVSRFVELGAWLQREYHARIVIVGGKGEEPLALLLQQRLGGTVNVVGETSLRQTGALLKRCHLFVGNDAGPMHLAAAAGIPVVEISCHPRDGSPSHHNSPSRFGPWGVPHVVLQRDTAIPPCSGACNASEAHCILGISVEEVGKAVVKILSRHGKSVFQK